MKHQKTLTKAAILLALGLAGQHTAAQAPATALPPPDAKMQQFVSKLMQQMTAEEKIGQLNLVSVGLR